jgi:hypothetical protein
MKYVHVYRTGAIMKRLRETWLAALLATALGIPGTVTRAADPAVVQVFKSPTCGCCAIWVDHFRESGFQVDVTEQADMAPVKQRFGIAPQHASCHTAVVNGYIVEGHVPAADIARLLEERPKIKGLVLPGMPIGSPGMEGPSPERYDVLALDASGATRVFATHKP